MISQKKVAVLAVMIVPLVLIALSMTLALAQDGDLDVGVFKYDDPDPVAAGDDLTYTIVVTNSDGVTATNVMVTDTLDTYVQYVSDTGGCSESSGEVTCSLPNMDPGEEFSFTIDVQVVPWAWDETSTLYNNVEVSATWGVTPDVNLGNNTAVEPTSLEGWADLAIWKEAFPPGGVVPTGEWFSYTLWVQNLGPSVPYGGFVMDWLATDGSLDLQPGLPVFLEDRSAHGMCGPMPTDQGWAETPAWLLNWVDTVCDVIGDPFICDLNDPWWGTWWAYWYNSFPPNYPYPLAVDWMCIWYVEDLYPGEEPLGLTVDVLPLDAQTIYDQAWVLSDLFPLNWLDWEDFFDDGWYWGIPDPDPYNNVDEIITEVIDDAADLGIEKGWEDYPSEWFDDLPYGPADCYVDGAVRAGCPLKFGLVVSNTGPALARNVVVEDLLPAGVTVDYVDWGPWGSCNTGIPGDPAAPLTCNLGSIPVDGSSWVDIHVWTDADLAWELLENDAWVYSDNFDPWNSNNRAYTMVWVEPFSILNVEKQGPEDVMAGEEIYYHLHVWNDGPSTAHDVGLDDELPGGVAFLGAQMYSGDGSCTPGTPRCSLGDMEPWDHREVQLWGYVEPWLAEGTPITNTMMAWAGSPFFQPVPEQPISDTLQTTVHSQADLSIHKTGDPWKVYAGEQKRYDIEVTNHGPGEASGVIVTDTLDSGVEYEIATIGCNPISPTVVACDLGGIPPGETVGFSIFVRVKPDTLGDIHNHVDVGSLNDPNSGNNGHDEMNLVLGKADLKVTKYGKPDGISEAGDRLTYTVIVDNLGPGYAHDVVLYDLVSSSSWAYYVYDWRSDLPADCSLDEWGRDTNITCHLDDPLEVMSPSSSGRWVLKFYLRAFEEQSVNNVAHVVSSDFDPDPSNNQAIAEHDITAVADLEIIKEGWGEVLVGCEGETEIWLDEVAAGGEFEYVIEIYNDGPSTAENVVVEDWGISPFLDIVEVMCEKDGEAPGDGCSCSTTELGELGDENRRLVCYLGTMDEDDLDEIFIVALVPSDVPEGEILRNDVRVYSDIFDDDNGDDMDTNWTTVIATADLEVEKTQDMVALPGLEVTYSITVTNHGPSDAHGVMISDTLPFTPTTMTMECCASDGGDCDVECEVPTCPAGECPWPEVDFIAQADIPAGEWVIYTLSATPEWVPCEPITNTVEVVAPQSVVYEEDIDPCDDNNVAYSESDPLCNFVPLAMKNYASPDSTP